MSEEFNSFKAHSEKQEEIIFSTNLETVVISGTQWGKSQAGALWLKLQCHTFTDLKDNFLMTAPSYKILHQSMLPYFLECMRGYGEFVKSDAVFKIHSGGTVYMRTNTDPDSIVGIPNIRAFWGDEVGKYTLYFWENIRARVASKGARILLTTSPYSMNWLWRDIVKPHMDGKLPNIKFVKASSWENPYHTLFDPVKRAAEQNRMDPRRFDMQYGGNFGKMQGLVYDCWDDDENYIKPFDLPTGTRFLAGVDWGYTDPFCLLIRAITPDGMQYGVSEFYKSRLSPSEIINIAKQKMQTFKIERFVCDPSRPDMIEEFNRNGLPAIKANNDIKFGIGIHYDLIKARKYKEFIGTCPFSRDEREVYHYPEPKDLGPDDKQKELLPVDANNHSCIAKDELVFTKRGKIPIKNVAIGDFVLTRNGWHRVLNAWSNGVRPVVTLKFKSGRVLRCTGDHKIYTKNRGFIEANSLCNDDIFVTDLSCQIRSFIRAEFLEDIQITAIKALNNIFVFQLLAALFICIVKFGRIIMGRSQRAIIFIIKMGIGLIIQLKTWSAFKLKRICRNIPLIHIRRIEKDRLNIWQKSIHSQRLGIDQKRVDFGTQITVKKLDLIKQQSRNRAINVKKNMTLLSFLKVNLNSAQIIVNRLGVGKAALITKIESVKFVRKFLQLINTCSRNVVGLFVAENLLAIQKEGEIEVFDLTVENRHEFIASGILVSNCDAQRYLSIEARTFVKEKPMKPLKSTNPFDAILKGSKNQGTENFS